MIEPAYEIVVLIGISSNTDLGNLEHMRFVLSIVEWPRKTDPGLTVFFRGPFCQYDKYQKPVSRWASQSSYEKHVPDNVYRYNANNGIAVRR